MTTSDYRLTQRALSAYWRTNISDAPDTPDDASVTAHGGLTYVVLTGSHRTLAVYRVLNSGALKRLRRWPEEIESS